jgi:hypothetical protein
VKVEVESMKDIVQEQLGESEPVAKQDTLSIVSQPIPNTANGGTKRQRVALAASKAIEDEDEPRSSPTMRKTSLGKQEAVETERKVLGTIENV